MTFLRGSNWRERLLSYGSSARKTSKGLRGKRARSAQDDRTGAGFLGSRGLKKGDRCALLAHNSIRWVAMDLAIMAEGLIVVPLYARQAPAELRGHDEGLLSGVDLLRRCECSATRIMEIWPESAATVFVRR